MEQDEFSCMEMIFSSSEHRFIYNEGVNRGHTMTYSKVNRCLFLSAQAKQLYNSISEYAYSGKRDCFPSQHSLRISLGWSQPTITKYTEELVAAGMIEVSRPNGRNYTYRLQELHKVAMLAHSELIYQVTEKYKEDGGNVFKAIESYKTTGLCAKASITPFLLHAEVKAYFNKRLEKFEPSYQLSLETLPVMSLPPMIHPQEEGNRVQPSDERAAKKPSPRGLGWEDCPIGDWNTNHFIEYFGHLYQMSMKLPAFPSGAKERGQMKRIVEIYRDSKEMLKRKMEVYVREGYFHVKGVSHFCSNYVQGLLDQFLRTGTFEKKKPYSLANQDDGDEADDLFAARRAKLRSCKDDLS